MFSIHIFFIPLVGSLLILLDYHKNRATDSLMKTSMFTLIIGTTATVAAEFFTVAYMGVPGSFARNILYVGTFIFFAVHLIAYYGAIVVIDYTINQNPARIKKIAYILTAIFIFNLTLLVLNIGRGFYFSITPDNLYVQGGLYFLRLIISYSAVLFIFVDLLLSRKNVNKGSIQLTIFFAMSAVAGGVLDLTVPKYQMTWLTFWVALLYVYLFIVREASKTDILTNINNRRSLDSYLAEMTKSTRKKPYGFIMIDLDHFKEINDKYGHAEGDRALRDFSDILKLTVRKQDFVARYGGDEFLAIIHNVSNLDDVLARLQKNTASANAKNKRMYKLKLSIGSDIYTPDMICTPTDFVKRVDSLMYKSRGDRRSSR